MSTPADTLIVLIGDEVAGTLIRARNQTLSFTYDDAYRAQTDPTPLSLSIPVQVRTHSDRVIRPWCDNLLPDNNAVLERWAKRFQVSATSPFGLLSSPVGLDCAGAVRFVAPERLDAALASPARTTFLDEAAVAARLVELRNDTTAWLGTDFTGRFSLGGAQAKTALSYHGRRWGLPSGSAATTHILKPAILGPDDHDLNEHLCLRAAALAGLIAVRTQVMAFATEQAIVIERYDRTYRRRRLVRVHQEDACGALGVAPASKYQSDGGPGAADIAGLLRRSMPSTVADDAIWRFADAVVWNWLIGGTDAHAKNYSLLLAGSQVRLAPLYDIASALPYWPEQKLRLAMKLGGDYQLTVQRTTTWKRLAAEPRGRRPHAGAASTGPRRADAGSLRRRRRRGGAPAEHPACPALRQGDSTGDALPHDPLDPAGPFLGIRAGGQASESGGVDQPIALRTKRPRGLGPVRRGRRPPGRHQPPRPRALCRRRRTRSAPR